ncbi:lysosomal enzyme trafficking factor isoform X1 [Serinus canaria]|uniref:lysosomal enzyme trafficking factor isoform X1 n=1 Tax=Serinus canaria TaxID=9135 RepID=UPI0021CCBA4C|nr:lysosomal enzyme trafficking factor isoform X1 [Serinus canaria]
MVFMFSVCTCLAKVYFPRRRQLVSQLGYAELLKKTASGLFSGCRAWRMMNFRQRMGWIGVGLYLLASAAAFYYVFEINETYNKLALEHIQQHPKEPQEGTTWTHSLKVRLLSLPFWLWTIIFLIPYLQMFLFLYSCTRADPKTVGYCIIPICLAVICNRHQTFVKASNQISRLQLIDT